MKHRLSYLYSGGYCSQDGVHEMLYGFIIADVPSTLYLTGDVPVDWQKIVECYDNIICLGFLPKNELINFIKNVDFCLCPRNTVFEHVNTTFPSKLLKYMQFGRPIVCTCYPGLPPSLMHKLILVNDNTQQLWCKAFKTLQDSLNRGQELHMIDYGGIPETCVSKMLDFVFCDAP